MAEYRGARPKVRTSRRRAATTMAYDTLQNIVSVDSPDWLLEQLLSEKEAFKGLLKVPRLQPKYVRLILEAMSKIIKSNCRSSSVKSLMNLVVRSQFLSLSLTSHIHHWPGSVAVSNVQMQLEFEWTITLLERVITDSDDGWSLVHNAFKILETVLQELRQKRPRFEANNMQLSISRLQMVIEQRAPRKDTIKTNKKEQRSKIRIPKYLDGPKSLTALLKQDSVDLLVVLVQESYGFNELLNTNVTDEILMLMLRALVKAGSCSRMPEARAKLLKTVLQSVFFESELPTYIISVPFSQVSNKHTSELFDESLSLLEIISARISQCNEKVLTLLGKVDSALCHIWAERPNLNTDGIETRIEKVRKRISSSSDKRYMQRFPTRTKNMDSESPPEDFRCISIIPQLEDIHTTEDIFLRSNKTQGAYTDLNHYLDVQFRLLREDFVAPLREGILDFIQQSGKSGPKKRDTNIRLYEDVHVHHPLCTNGGLVYKISFNSDKLKFVRWESSKRLIYGSLVCLSNNKFQTFCFATVGERKPGELRQGIVYLQFTDHDTKPCVYSKDTYLMAETSAYFEAYKYVLRGLQDFDENKMPFQQYIVGCSRKVSKPQYIERSSTTYDFSCICSQASKAIQSVPLMKLYAWPSAAKLNFDESQLRAVKAALTREFVVIQGPPGTGKTYVGLKIVKALLYNKDIWQNYGSSPMLVVCYTNHALDQFLEGILDFHTEGVVRVGGRSQSETLEEYNLANWRKKKHVYQWIPKHVKLNTKEVKKKLAGLKFKIDQQVGLLKFSGANILSLSQLQELVLPIHFKQLQTNPALEENIPQFVCEQRPPVMEWLGLLPLLWIQEEPEAAMRPAEETNTEEAEAEYIDILEDAELIEKARRIDDDEDLFTDNVAEDGTVDENSRKPESTNAVKQTDVNKESVIAEDSDQNKRKERSKETSGSSALLLPSVNPKETWILIAEEKKKAQSRKKTELRKTSIMTEEECTTLLDIWTLSGDERWRLYRTWRQSFEDCIQMNIQRLERLFEEEYSRYKESKQQQDLAILKRATIIGMTTTGAARYWNILQQIGPRIVIVEEAAEVLEAHIITTLSPDCNHLILIGDHQQLRPNPTVYELALRYNLDLSLFERMVNNGMECVTLALQHRMRPEISTLMKPIYKDLQDHPSVLKYESIKGASKNMFFVDHSRPEKHHQENKSKSNSHEAEFLVALCRYMLQQGYSPDQITVLTTYSGQLFALKHLMPKSQFEGVRVCVVDNFQGEESDIVLLSLVRSNTEGSIGFLNTANRICVALSRAKKGFYVIGNVTLLAKHSPLWKDMYTVLAGSGSVGPALSLYCQNHPDSYKIEASTAADIMKAPEGGCMKPCEFSLKCGHPCRLSCHPYDKEHTEYKCIEVCNRKLCALGHKCKKKCHEECGVCKVKVKKDALPCGHTNFVPCYVKSEEIKCTAPCVKFLPCGHVCRNKCGEECNTTCAEIVEKEWDGCKHKNRVPCNMDPKENPCRHPCRETRTCGHTCRGTCSHCKQGEQHIACYRPCERVLPCKHKCRATCQDNCPPCNKLCERILPCGHRCRALCSEVCPPCNKPCDRILICGHKCRSQCSEICPPCSRPCKKGCQHTFCKQKCRDPCDVCTQPCGWSCMHKKCTQQCHEMCNIDPCDEPCAEELACKHPCIGLSGESCPTKCRVCDRDFVKLLKTTEPCARFLQLEDCSHLVEVAVMEKYMDVWRNAGTVPLYPPRCPVCQIPILRSKRYGNLLKTIYAAISQVQALESKDKKNLARKTTGNWFKCCAGHVFGVERSSSTADSVPDCPECSAD